MRLFNARQGFFQDFYDAERPAYAILSHCWGADEVLFKDFKDTFTTGKTPLAALQARASYAAKIKPFGDQALRGGVEWVWADTVCIDKRSSAELSEAINSMYRWYADAAVCFVYMADVVWRGRDGIQATLAEFRASRWFRRGWTLQELLAPKKMQFFDRAWASIGMREQFASMITLVTGIPLQFLHGRRAETIVSAEASIAQKMSWMTDRETSRGEDIAYCMLGLFDVNMPLLYGEGREKAFVRLQMEILKKSTDETIFAWKSGDQQDFSGLIAERPEYFRGATDTKCSLHHQPRAYTMTNRGLQINGPFVELSKVEGDIDTSWMRRVRPRAMYAMVLNCYDDPDRRKRKVILLADLDGTFWRLMPQLLESSTYTPDSDDDDMAGKDLTIYQHWR